MIDNELTYFSNIHEWDAGGWVEIKTDGPGPRNAAPLVYDPVRKQTLLFGGVFENAAGFKIHFDVWGWDGKAWKLVSSECPVKEPNVAYDPNEQRVLVYGESTNKTNLIPEEPQEYELWEFKDDRWRKLSADGPNVYSAIAFDSERNVLIIPSLEEDALVWEWNKNEWYKISCSSNCPVKRTRQAIAYSPAQHATYLFGGRDNNGEYLNDFWKWNGKSWSNVSSPESPDKRASAHLVPANDKLLLYGGSLKGSLSNELWSWDNNTWKKLK